MSAPNKFLAALNALTDTIEHLKTEQTRLCAEAARSMRKYKDGEEVRIYDGPDRAKVYAASLMQLNNEWHLHYTCKVEGREKWLNVPAEHVHPVTPSNP